MNFKRVCIYAAALYAGAAVATAAWAAGPHEPSIRDFAKSTVTAWVSSPKVVAAIKAQNVLHAGLSKDEIIARDKQWRAETGSAERPLIDRVLSNDISRFLSKSRRNSKASSPRCSSWTTAD